MGKNINRSICFWPDDWDRIKTMAATSGMSASEFIRRGALGEKILPLDHWRVIAYINKTLGLMNENKLSEARDVLLACRDEVADNGRNY